MIAQQSTAYVRPLGQHWLPERVQLTPFKRALIEGVAGLLLFGMAGNHFWNTLVCPTGVSITLLLLWTGLCAFACFHVLDAAFTLVGTDQLVETDAGVVRERALFGIGFRTYQDPLA
jgi:hypothetical protein